MRNNYLYLLVMFAVSYAIRTTPLTLLRKPIQNRFLRSFLYYVPYACLTAMTVPAIFFTTENWISGAAALAVGIGLAYCGKSLLTVALSCSAAVLVLEKILTVLG